MPETRRTIHIHRDQWHLAWDHSIPPIASLRSGETISFDLLDASCGQIVQESTVDAIQALDFSRVDQVNGPIYVEGAEPGDTLEVEFVDLQPAAWGWTAIIPGFGLLADEFPEPALKIWRLEGGAEGWAEFAPGIRLPLAPFCGEIGLAPAAEGALSTIPPYRDGEVCGTAIETPMRATVRLSVRKDIQVPEPQFLTAGPLAQRANTAGYYATDGIGPDLMEAARQAIRHMIDYLQHTHHLSRPDAYMLCSVAVDLKLCEVVDAPHWLVSAFLPQSIFTTPAK